MSKPKICPYPFSRLVAGKNGFVPCCSDWLTEEIYPAKSYAANPWNSAEAQELRRRILQGDYALCRRDRCRQPIATLDELKRNPNLCPDAPLDDAALKAIEKGQTELESGPLVVSISADARCNLRCPSCRPDYIHHLSDFDRRAVAAAELVFLSYADRIRIVRLAGNGEVFFSPWLRSLLQSLGREQYPSIEYIAILSNGLLFDAKQLEELRPGSDFIRKVCITVDAGDEETYKKVRGGDWRRLVKNLKWMGEQRKGGRFDNLVFQLIVQKKNYASIPKLIEFSKRVGADLVNLYEIYDWSTGMDHEEAAVHVPSHPEYEKMMSVLDPFREDPMVRISLALSRPQSAVRAVSSFGEPSLQ